MKNDAMVENTKFCEIDCKAEAELSSSLLSESNQSMFEKGHTQRRGKRKERESSLCDCSVSNQSKDDVQRNIAT